MWARINVDWTHNSVFFFSVLQPKVLFRLVNLMAFDPEFEAYSGLDLWFIEEGQEAHVPTSNTPNPIKIITRHAQNCRFAETFNMSKCNNTTCRDFFQLLVVIWGVMAAYDASVWCLATKCNHFSSHTHTHTHANHTAPIFDNAHIDRNFYFHFSLSLFLFVFISLKSQPPTANGIKLHTGSLFCNFEWSKRVARSGFTSACGPGHWSQMRNIVSLNVTRMACVHEESSTNECQNDVTRFIMKRNVPLSAIEHGIVVAAFYRSVCGSSPTGLWYNIVQNWNHVFVSFMDEDGDEEEEEED